MNGHPQDWPACELCRRNVPPELITLHHLTPRQRGGKAEHRLPLCKACHKQVHATYSNKDLERLYSDIESLRRAPLIQPFLRWIRIQKPDRTFRTITHSDHPRTRRGGFRRGR